MNRILNANQFKSLLKYTVANGDYPNCDRCNAIDVVLNGVRYSLTICFNEKKHQVCICEVFKVITKSFERNGKMVEIEYKNPEDEKTSDELKGKCFNELLRLASGDWTMDEKGKDMYKFYIKEIEPETECCELNQ